MRVLDDGVVSERCFASDQKIYGVAWGMKRRFGTEMPAKTC